MNHRYCALFLILSGIALPAVVLPTAVTTEAWGLNTHLFIASEAMGAITNQSWYDAFALYAAEVLAGSTTPDQEWQDWDNHLYYPETGEYNAPWAAEHWFNMTRDNFSAGNWEDGFFAVGVMTHYFADPCIPVHTDEYWDGHVGYERDINENLGTLDLEVPTEVLIENVSQFVIDCATYSHQYYDTVRAAYDNNDSRSLDDPTIKALTEDCLSMAINGCLSLFYTLQQYAEPPDTSLTFQYKALIDYAHSNDYIDYSGESQLTSLELTLEREGFETFRQEQPFSTEALSDIDLLVITCALDAYTQAELTAIADWADSGERSLLVTSRGDFSTYTDIAQVNAILAELGSMMRSNDDNVYMEGTYQPWYNDLTSVPEAEDTLNLTGDVTSLTLFSPTSLYFLNENPVLPLAFADASAYQTDQTGPEPEVLYDIVQDGIYGDQIPLIAAEEIGALRVLLSGTTFFSNFDYGRSSFDNVQLLKNFLEWAVEDRPLREIEDIDQIGPRISNPEVSYSSEDEAFLMRINITDASAIESVIVKFQAAEGTDQFNMTHVEGNLYEAIVPEEATASPYLRVIASDAAGNTGTRIFHDIDMTTSTTTPIIGLPIELILVAGIAAVVLVAAVVVAKKR